MIYTCPVCQGSGFVPRKMYEVPGVTCSFWSYMNDNGVIQCNSCNGTGVIRKNDWIKCTDRMPPDMEPVMVTMTDGCKITVLPCCRWNNKYNEWDMLNDWNWEEWLALGEKEKVTHWMPWPEPAED